MLIGLLTHVFNFRHERAPILFNRPRKEQYGSLRVAQCVLISKALSQILTV
jgi:hypothetical protein